MRAGLYLHYPFCLKKCLYCDFNSSPASEASRREYPSLLLKEMELQRASLPEAVASATLYFGGGTPSLMEPAEVGAFVDAAARLFQLDGEAEVTLEANPGTLTADKLAGYRAAGVNRISLGIQSLDDRLLARLGRVHTAREGLLAIEAARQAGFANIGLDLMHSLPGQPLAQWRETLQRAVDLAPDHISAYALSVEEGTPFAALEAAGRLPLPTDEEQARMFESTAEILSPAGYLHYEISNFARDGHRSRHNSAYWQRESYLGFGAGAHSFWNPDGIGVRWHNPEAGGEYREAVLQGAGLQREREREELTREQAIAESFFLGLRLLEGLDLAPLRERFGEDALATRLAEVARLAEAGAIIEEGSQIRLSAASVVVANAVFSRFL